MIIKGKTYLAIEGENKGKILEALESEMPNDVFCGFLLYFKDLETQTNVCEYSDNLIEVENKISDSKVIEVKYFSDIEPLKLVENSDWVDLRSAIDVDLKQGDFKLIPLGVGMKLPSGYEAHIVPRSSTFKNFGVIQTNHQAVVDESFCGDNDQIFYPVLAMRDTHISKNDRICQFRIMKKQPRLLFETVGYLEDKNRGGFGSSGAK